MSYSIDKISVKKIGLDFEGEGDYILENVAGLSSANKTSLTFYKGDDIESLYSYQVGALIVSSMFKDRIDFRKISCNAILFSENPMFSFIQFVNKRFDNLFVDESQKRDGISKSAYVEPDVKIGKKTVIYPNASVYSGTEIGNNCTVQSSTVIGGIGMSYTVNKGGFERLTHLGNVVIHDNVDIGCNTTVLRGILESTVIGKGTKIGNHVNVGHNTQIGENCYISAGVIIGGATIIGNNCWIAPGVSIRDHIIIGDNCTVGVGSVVVKDTKSNSVYYGSPAKFVKNKN